MLDYEQLREAIDKKLTADPEFRVIVRRINGGRATFNDTARYAQLTAKAVSNELSAEVLDLSDRENIAKQLLRDSYDDINNACIRVQKAMDERTGINIRPQQADFPEERAQQFTHSLVDPTVADEVIQRRARAGSDTIIKSSHDDFIRKNAAFRNDAGLTCYIIREGSNCCPWCSSVAGKYRFGTQPDDIFRRHDNCDCTIIYDGQKLRGKRNADGSRSKTWEEVPDADGSYAPTSFTQEQAKELERQNLQRFRGLTSGKNSGTMESERNMANGLRKSSKIALSDDDKNHLLNEINAIGADPSIFVFRDGFGTAYSDERDIVFVSSNVFPSNDNSLKARDLMSERAALAHEYYGHRAYRGTKLEKGSWNDEFRASYMASKNCPNLSDQDRYYLVLDALDRAKEAGVTVHYNDYIRRVLYGEQS